MDRVYFNLHRKVWSVQGADRRVRAHYPAVAMLDVTFRVSAAGREVVGAEAAFLCSDRSVTVYGPKYGDRTLFDQLVVDALARGEEVK